MVITIAYTINIDNFVVTHTVSNLLPSKSQYILPIATIANVAYSDWSPPINQSTRMNIYSYIINNAGIHFRGICRGLGLSIGVVQFHLQVLESSGLISSIRYRRCKRFFQLKTYSKTEKILLSLLREKTAGKILCLLVEKHEILHTKLSNILGITSQALTWQIHRLHKEGLIGIQKDGIKNTYSLLITIKPTVEQCISFIKS